MGLVDLKLVVVMLAGGKKRRTKLQRFKVSCSCFLAFFFFVIRSARVVTALYGFEER